MHNDPFAGGKYEQTSDQRNLYLCLTKDL